VGGRYEDGYALVAVLLFLLLGSVLGMGLLGLTLNSHQAVLASEYDTRAKYLAEYGAMVGLDELQRELWCQTEGRAMSCEDTDQLIRRLVDGWASSGSPDGRPEELYTYALAVEDDALKQAKTTCVKNSPFETVLGAQYTVEAKLIAGGYVHKDGRVPGRATVEVPVQITNLAKVFDYAVAAKNNIWFNGGAVIEGDVYVGEAMAVHPWVHYPLWYSLELDKLEFLLNLNNLLNPGKVLSQLLDALLGWLLDLLGLDLTVLIEKVLNLNELLQTLLVLDIGYHEQDDLYPKIDGTLATAEDVRFYHINDSSHCSNVGREVGYALEDLLENLTNVLESVTSALLNLDRIIQGLQYVLFQGDVEAGMHPLKDKYRTDDQSIRQEHYVIGDYRLARRPDVEFPTVDMKRIKGEVARKAGFQASKYEDELFEYRHQEHVTRTYQGGTAFHYVTGLRKKCLLGILLCDVDETKTVFTLNAGNQPGSGQHIYYINGDLIVEGQNLNLGAVFYVNGNVEFRNVAQSTNVVAGTIVVNGDVRFVNIDKPLEVKAFIWQNRRDGTVFLYGVESAVHLSGGIVADNVVLNGARQVPKGQNKKLVNDPSKDDFVYRQGSSQGQVAPPLLYIRHDGEFLRTPPPGVPTEKGLYLLQQRPWVYVDTKE